MQHIFFLVSALAAEPRLGVQTNLTTLGVGDSITIQVFLSNAPGQRIPDIRAEKGISVETESSSSKVAMVNGVRTDDLTATICVRGLAPGQWSIASDALEWEGREYRIPPVTFEVLPEPQKLHDSLRCKADRPPPYQPRELAREQGLEALGVPWADGAGSAWMVLVDASASMGERKNVHHMQVAREGLTQALGALPAGHVGLLSFGADVLVQLPPTPVRATVVESVGQLAAQSTSTATGVAMMEALRQLAPHGGGAMLLITDGKATSGEVTFAEAVDVARALGVVLHVVFIETPERAQSPDAGPPPELVGGAGRTGGKVRTVHDVAGLVGALQGLMVGAN